MGLDPATVARTGSAKDAVAVSNIAMGDADVTERRQNSSTVGSPLGHPNAKGAGGVPPAPVAYSIQTTAALLLAATAAAVIATTRPLRAVRVGRVTSH